MANKTHVDDPRDAALETKVTFPKAWNRDSFSDLVSLLAIFLAGVIIISRNRYIAWPTFILGLNGVVNQHPLRSKEGTSNRSHLGMAVTALVVTYLPFFIAPTVAPPSPSPGS